MTIVETANQTHNRDRLPSKDEKEKRNGKKRIPRRAKTVHKTFKKIDGSLQENILTLLCFDTESCDKIISQVPVLLFDCEHYRTIAERAIKYYRKYGKAAGDHLPDLFEDFLSTSKRSKDRLYQALLHDLHDLSKSINRKFVLDELQKFVRQQYLRQTITTAAEEIQKGNVAGTIMQLTKGLERAGRPQTQGISAGLLSDEELRRRKDPPVIDAAYPIIQFPGITFLSGSFASAKTLSSAQAA